MFMEHTVFVLDCSGLYTATVNSTTCVNSDFPFYFLVFVCNVCTYLLYDDPLKLFGSRQRIAHVTKHTIPFSVNAVCIQFNYPLLFLISFIYYIYIYISILQKVQQDATILSWFSCKTTQHVWSTFRTHHQEYNKLKFTATGTTYVPIRPECRPSR
jgi:hypothetical protein